MESPRRPCFAEEDDGLASIARRPVFSRIVPHRTITPFPHFLEACCLCKKLLAGNRDIFMYRGDMPFCSEECRGEQIEADEAMEKSLCLSASVKKALRNNNKKSTSSSPDKSQKFRAGTVAAA